LQIKNKWLTALTEDLVAYPRSKF